ncbi:IQ domain-containing protein K isoform X3 [Rattus rattus]|uniref:IQ domain-containing protein K isoform X3 n=1 Tax=Rattus rattus TaxID=10117 RepID=UPI0013F304B9|nr:IQ domain-containing protein K isoform X3 [Rattus rattus]
MAVPRQASSRSVLREEAGGAADSPATTRMPGLAGSPGSPEVLALPAQVAEPPEKNLWEQICEEYEAEQPTFPEGYKVKQEAAVTVSSVTPLEELVPHGFNMEHYLPVQQFPVTPPVPCPPKKAETVEPKACSPRDYLEMFIFPVLLPGMANLLHQAKREKCFERKRTKFIACDFLTEWLYKIQRGQGSHSQNSSPFHLWRNGSRTRYLGAGRTEKSAGTRVLQTHEDRNWETTSRPSV